MTDRIHTQQHTDFIICTKQDCDPEESKQHEEKSKGKGTVWIPISDVFSNLSDKVGRHLSQVFRRRPWWELHKVFCSVKMDFIRKPQVLDKTKLYMEKKILVSFSFNYGRLKCNFKGRLHAPLNWSQSRKTSLKFCERIKKAGKWFFVLVSQAHTLTALLY